MPGILRVFVGAETFSGEVVTADTDELLEMGKKAAKEGWVLRENLRAVLKEIESENPDVLEVGGGLAGCCVAIAVETGLRLGVGEIVVRESMIRSTVNKDPVDALKRSLGANSDSTRIKIIP